MPGIFSQYISVEISAFWSVISLFNRHLHADKLLELLPLYQLLRTHIEHERAIRRAEHAVDLIDADVAVLSSLPNRQRQFLRDRYLLDFSHHCASSFPASDSAFQTILMFHITPFPLVPMPKLIVKVSESPSPLRRKRAKPAESWFLNHDSDSYTVTSSSESRILMRLSYHRAMLCGTQRKL